MADALRIAIAGLGTVGLGTVRLLVDQAGLLEARCGRPIQIVAVSAKHKQKSRSPQLDTVLKKATWYDDARDMAVAKDVDVVVELIGGSEGVAYDVCVAALTVGKHVVTANKALIARHGVALATLAQQQGVALAFEASVAGGIPVIKVLKEGLAGNRIHKIAGIMNGTCNYILSTMRETGRDFLDILTEAQRLGYAEADPAFDVDGIDTAHKLAILTALAFGTPVNFKSVFVEGIRTITQDDIRYAKELGYTIKLLGVCRLSEQGVEQAVYPAMVQDSAALAQVGGVNNAVLIQSDAVGTLVLTGPGAGSLPTASAVVADICDIAAGRISYPFNRPVEALSTQPESSIDHHACAYYLRLHVQDKAGVLARITDILGKVGISMESVLQKPAKMSADVHIAGITHITDERTMMNAVSQLGALESVLDAPHVIRVEE